MDAYKTWLAFLSAEVITRCLDRVKENCEGCRISLLSPSGVTTAPATPAMQGGGSLGGRHITKLTVF